MISGGVHDYDTYIDYHLLVNDLYNCKSYHNLTTCMPGKIIT